MTDTTYVAFLLDRSWSMGSIRASTIEAYNAYIAGLKESCLDYCYSLIQFDNIGIDTFVKNAAIKDVPELTEETFQPRGGTPLIDAAMETIRAVERALATRTDKPKVVICFQTDGEDNNSTKHTWEELADLIRAKTAEDWQFNFMGAGINAYRQAGRMGVSQGGTMSYDASNPVRARAAFSSHAASTARFASGQSATTNYFASEKAAAGDAFDPDLKVPTATQFNPPVGLTVDLGGAPAKKETTVAKGIDL